jgi:cytochrome P450
MPASTKARFAGVDISSPAHKANPFPFYEKLRAEHPICEIPMPSGQSAWLVTRYDDVVSVLKDGRFAKNPINALTSEQAKKQPWMPAVFKPLLSNMLDSDAPNHTRLRALVQKAFTPKRVEAMQDRIQSLADGLLHALRNRRRFDLIGEYALPLPATVIAEMLGVPASDRHKFHRWSSSIVSVNWSKWAMIKGVPAVWRFLRYVRGLVKLRRRKPEDDMITALVQAREGGDRLSENELVAMIFLLLIAGHETTVNLIANGMLALFEHPDQLERLRDEPSLIQPAVEELLRFAPPLDTATERYAREDVTISGVTIPRGSLVFAVLCSANRDEAHFPEPNALDITREPNKHLSFGLGIHFCLGAPLARLETLIAIGTLLRRSPELQLASPLASLRWRRGLVLRGMKSLPVLRGTETLHVATRDMMARSAARFASASR